METWKMNKQLTQQNLDELMKQTLLNILSSKGIIYRYYLKHLQQKHQSNYQNYLPKIYE